MTERAGDTIAVRHVHKRFGRLEVLSGIDMAVASGETVAVLGPSGSGKSTLVRCINHLEPIQDGTIEVGGIRITPQGLEAMGGPLSHRDIAKFRTNVGMVFQAFNLFPHLTVMGNIIEAPVHVLGWPRAQAIEKATALLDKVNLLDKAKVYPPFLSGGQQQRVAIVRALVMDPKVMLFDEPTSALDPELTGEVLKVIGDLAIRGRTSIIVTHELGFARDVADKIVFMDAGKVVEEGSPADVLDAPKTDRARAFIRKIE
jgi:ABC-type polar amino acid transport system ATPase subunit